MESPLCQDTRLASDPDFRLIETFGWSPGDGFQRLERHLARMQRSARTLGIAFDGDAAGELLETVTGDTALRCRLTLDGEGRLGLTTATLGETPSEWVLVVADARVRSDDPWLQHKTTRRALYDSTRAQLPTGVGEAVFLNERGELCEGTITNVFVTLTNGDQVTPPLTSGLLPGIMRETLLERGDMREQVVTLHDLRDAQSIAVGNSLRGMIAARLLPLDG